MALVECPTERDLVPASGYPAVITRNGKKEAVVLSFSEYEKLTKVPSFVRFLAAFPGDEGDILARNNTPARTVDF